jgi:hypothetical protein
VSGGRQDDSASKRSRSSHPLSRYACELLEREAFGKTVILRETLQAVVRRLSPGDHSIGDAAAEITVLRQVAEKVPAAGARTEILKAVALLRDKSR